MKNNISYSVLKSSSKISPEVRLGLIISIVIALILAAIILIWSFWYKKKVVKKYLSPNEKEEINKLKANNPNYGIVLNGIKKYYGEFANDFFTCFLINTIYINKYNHIYIEDDSDYISISIANLTNETEIKYNGSFSEDIRNKIQNEFSNISFDKIKNSSNLSEKVDFMLFLKQENNLKNILQEKISLLDEKGIIIISIKNSKLSKNYNNLFNEFNLRHETLKFKNKSVILLAKGNIKDRVEKGE